MFIKNPNMCKIITMMNKVMDNQPVKNRHELKPLDISNAIQETNKESTSELGVCIVLWVFKGMVDGMYGYIYGVMTCISAWKYDSKTKL